jgi:hypothetical protein
MPSEKVETPARDSYGREDARLALEELVVGALSGSHLKTLQDYYKELKEIYKTKTINSRFESAMAQVSESIKERVKHLEDAIHEMDALISANHDEWSLEESTLVFKFNSIEIEGYEYGPYELRWNISEPVAPSLSGGASKVGLYIHPDFKEGPLALLGALEAPFINFDFPRFYEQMRASLLNPSDLLLALHDFHPENKPEKELSEPEHQEEQAQSQEEEFAWFTQ